MGIEIRLSPKLFKLVEILVLRNGGPVPHDDIIEYIWDDPDKEPDGARKQLHVMTCNLRTVGILVSSDWQRNYYLGSAGWQYDPVGLDQQEKQKKQKRYKIREAEAVRVIEKILLNRKRARYRYEGNSHSKKENLEWLRNLRLPPSQVLRSRTQKPSN